MEGGEASQRDAEVLVTGAVIAGGRSRRMGTDKRAILIDGAPLLRRSVLAVASVSSEVLVVCRLDDLPDPSILEGLPVRLVHDRLADAGPLAGLEAALAAARGEVVLVVAGDMPWLEPRVLRLLVDEAGRRPGTDAVALASEHGAEPLIAVYRRRVLPVATGLLDAGERRAHALLESVPTLEIPEERWRALDPSGGSIRSVNEPADLPRVAGRSPSSAGRS